LKGSRITLLQAYKRFKVDLVWALHENESSSTNVRVATFLIQAPTHMRTQTQPLRRCRSMNLIIEIHFRWDGMQTFWCKSTTRNFNDPTSTNTPPLATLSNYYVHGIS
jgi:transposase-like protein